MLDDAILPNEEILRRDLEFMTARWGELSAPTVFEVRAIKEHSHPQIAKFAPDWIGEAVDFIVGMVGLGYNTYVTRNPLRHDAKATGATDADVLAAFYLWADCDEAEAAANLHRFTGPKWSAAVMTGRTPHARVHPYWELDVPCTDLPAWTHAQKAIAAHLKSDRTVVNPSRIMRIAGSVNYPPARKSAKGYVKEPVTIRTKYSDARPPVTIAQMLDAVSAPQAPTQPQQRSQWQGFDAGGDTRSADDYGDILRRARTDGEKHGGVRDLAASLAAAGVNRLMAEAIIKEACPVWDRNAENLLDSAYTKFAPAPDANPYIELSEEQKSEIQAFEFQQWGNRDLAAIPYPEFLYSDFYARGYTSLTLAPPKVGKSMLALAESIDMASGRGFLTGQPREPLRVVYYNAEDDISVLESRVAALLTLYGIAQSEIAETLFLVSGVERDDFFMVSGQEGTINEPLFVGLEKFVSANNADVLIFDPLQDLSHSPETNEVFRFLGQRLRRLSSTTRVSLGLVHHTRKIAPGVVATIDDGRGGSALRGTARFNRLLVSMSEDEAAKAGVDNHRNYLRIGDIESNLAPPSADVNRWFRKISVVIPNGHSVGAIEAWQWPDAFANVTTKDVARVQHEIDQMAEPPRHDARSTDKWVGNIIADVLGLNLAKAADKAKAKTMLNKWVDTDVLRIVEVHDARAGRSTKGVICGANNPLAESGE
jgi:hypothetical protein